jgi:hypothetical protein
MNTQEKGKEVEKWRSFSIDGQTYDLSHLDADEVEYKDEGLSSDLCDNRTNGEHLEKIDYGLSTRFIA